jgi:RHS repeat-associated protein
MKTLTTILLVCTMLCGCRLYTVTQGDGYIYSESGNFLCVRNAGDCIEQYDTPTSETLSAQPAQDHAFRRWEGCNYKALTSCETDISQTAIDDDLEWTITAVFEKKRPDVQPAQYTYNALGQRITKTVGGVTTVFQYDLDGNLIAELDAGGHPLRQHVYLEGAPIAMLERKTPQSNTAVYYVHTDHLATPDLITNDNGRIVADFENTPFGVPHINYSEIDYHIGFPGQYYDKETGLHYNYHRNYDANTGRYVQSDPIGLRGGINTYAYVDQNPIIYIDKDGRLAIQLINLGVGAALGGYDAYRQGTSIFKGAVVGGLANAVTGRATMNAIINAAANLALQTQSRCFHGINYKQAIAAGVTGAFGLGAKLPWQPNLLSNTSKTAHAVVTQTIEGTIIKQF